MGSLAQPASRWRCFPDPFAQLVQFAEQNHEPGIRVDEVAKRAHPEPPLQIGDVLLCLLSGSTGNERRIRAIVPNCWSQLLAGFSRAEVPALGTIPVAGHLVEVPSDPPALKAQHGPQPPSPELGLFLRWRMFRPQLRT